MMTLTDAILDALLGLDPYRQGACWPDPIAWDGRPLAEQASDVLALMDDREDLTAERAVLEAAIGSLP